MSREIILVNSELKAIIDDCNFSFINQFSWYLKDGYAYTDEIGPEPIEMGRLVLIYGNSKLN